MFVSLRKQGEVVFLAFPILLTLGLGLTFVVDRLR